MKIILIAGFLGSGKTSVLLKLAKYLTESGASAVIIENEIGEVGVDDKLLRSAGLRMKEVFGGCICCGSSGLLLDDIASLRGEYNPDYIIIEATGVAYPLEIRCNIAEQFGIRAAVLGIADCSRWARLWNAMPQLLGDQLGCADLILLNKCDLVSSEQKEAALEILKTVNPAAEIQCFSAIDGVDRTELWKGFLV
ncbi:MAG: cobalamin biosynthesis protein P47K [Oscillospiraceae bacterium]|nr:cobalamin biosynthesis protein P47K [Oscillospiraceae bacterium]